MSLDVSDLIAAVDGDSEALARASPFLEDASNISTVLEIIFQQESLSNAKLFFTLSVVLKKFINEIVHNEPQTGDIVPIVTNILEFLNSPQYLNLNTSDLEVIPSICVRFCDADFSKWISEQFQTFFTAESNNRMTICGILVASEISHQIGLDPLECKESACSLAAPFFACKLEQLKSAPNSIITSELVKAFAQFGSGEIPSLNTEEVHAIYVMLVEFLATAEYASEQDIKTKYEITAFMKDAIAKFCQGEIPEQVGEFAGFFQSDILPALMQTVVDSVSFFVENRSTLNDMLLSGFIFLAMKFAELGQEQFFSEEFISQVILPSAILSNDQIVGYFQNPAQYIEFELAVNAKQEPFVRSALYFYVRKTAKLFDYTAVAPTAEITDPYDVESRVFLLICRYKPRTENEKLGLLPKEIGTGLAQLLTSLDLATICSLDVEEQLSNIESNVGEMREELGTFCLVPTILAALMKSKASSASLRDAAYSVFSSTHPSNVVLKASSLDLLYTAVSLCFDLGAIPLEDLVTGLVEFIQSPAKVGNAADFLGFMIENFDVAQSYGKELLEPLITEWRESLADDGEDQADFEEKAIAQEEMLDNINLILTNLSEEALQELAPSIVQTASELLEECGESGFLFVTVVGSVAMRLTTLPDVFGEFIPFLIQFVCSLIEQNQIVEIRPVADFITSVITKLGGVVENEEYVKTIVEFCQLVGGNEELFPNDKASVLVIIASLIMKLPQNISDLWELATQIFGSIEEELPVIYAMTYAAVAALTVTNGEIISSLPENLVGYWMTCSYDPEREGLENKLHGNAPITLRDRKFWAIALLYIARTGNAEALNNAFYIVESMMKTIERNIRRKELKALEEQKLREGAEEDVNEEDEAEMFEEEEEEFDEREQFEDDYFISDEASLPLDPLNALTFYVETVNGLNAQETQPEGFLEKVIELSTK